MVIVPSRVGQLGNQLFHIAHFAASAMEHRYHFHYAALEYPLENFPKLNSMPYVKVSTTSKRRNLCQHRLFKLLNMTISSSPFHRCLVSMKPPHVDTGGSEFVYDGKRKMVLCEGFGFRDPDNVAKHQSELSQLFQMSESIRSEVDQYELDHLSREGSMIVGFHIRRGDYQNYAGGQHYLDDAHWLALIREVKEYVEEKGKRFIGALFSNENVEPLQSGNPDLVAGPGGMFTDLEMLSRCDLIVAPMSTYSGWASFIGQVPLMRVKREKNPSMDFEVVTW